jgi:ATP:ADP antiporter, AAA family
MSNFSSFMRLLNVKQFINAQREVRGNGMGSKLKSLLKFLLDVERHELLKVILLSIAFFLVIGSYTIVRELKDVVFPTIIGQDRRYQAYAKIFSMLVLIPTLFFHSRLVDLLRRHYLLYFYATFYGLMGLVCVFFLGHPTIGLYNTISSPDRLFGWFFYFFIEGFAPLVVSVFWAFANSVTSPEAAKNNYTTMIAGSKLGGILTATTAWFLLRSHVFTDVVNHQILMGVSSGILLFVPLVIYFLVKKVPRKYMHGYEAAYQVEKERHKHHPGDDGWVHSMLSGLTMLFKYPYVMGIFGMSFFFELVSQALKVENIIFVRKMTTNLSEATSFLLWQALLVHIVAFVVVLFGTRVLLEVLGERRSLMLIPTLTGLSVIGFVLQPSYATAIFAFVVTRSVNYAFAAPLRESLYIPTVKEVQFKSKSWIDGVGAKFAKTCASSFNMYTDGLAAQLLLTVQSTFFSLIVGFWFTTAYLLGRRYERAVKHNEVIGSQEI